VKLTDDEIYAHYADISKAVGLPIVLYNIPGNAVNALSPALVRRLADLDRIVGVKESSGDWNNYYATAIAVQDRLRVFCGPSSVFGVPAVQAGADGVIDCFPNMSARLFVNSTITSTNWNGDLIVASFWLKSTESRMLACVISRSFA
jgi:4-hydroxy-tetrahydrodipicolinate synthase